MLGSDLMAAGISRRKKESLAGGSMVRFGRLWTPFDGRERGQAGHTAVAPDVIHRGREEVRLKRRNCRREL